MPPLTLVLLPGLDGTGEQFAPLLRELPSTIVSVVVRYPLDRALGYDELLPFALEQLPADRPFVLVGESFSGPLAIRIAAQRPSGLRALVLVATFHRRPVAPWLAMTRPFVRDFVFARPPPAFMIRRLLAGPDASEELVSRFRASVASVRGDVLATRVRAVLDVDVSVALSEVTVPITYLAATEDALVRRTIPDELRALVSSIEVQRFASPHLLLQRRPREAAAALGEIVARLAGVVALTLALGCGGTSPESARGDCRASVMSEGGAHQAHRAVCSRLHAPALPVLRRTILRTRG